MLTARLGVIGEVYILFDEQPTLHQGTLNITNYPIIVFASGNKKPPYVIVYFIRSIRIRPITKVAILQHGNFYFVKIGVFHLFRTQSLSQYL